MCCLSFIVLYVVERGRVVSQGAYSMSSGAKIESYVIAMKSASTVCTCQFEFVSGPIHVIIAFKLTRLYTPDV
jgi:hypothetical protein